MQQVWNGDRKQCLRENKSIDNCVKHVFLLVSAAVDGQKAATNSDDVGFSAKRISTLKGHSDLYVHDCINHQIDVSESRCRMRQHLKDFHHYSANYRNRWSWKTSSLRCLVQLPLQLIQCLKCKWHRPAGMRGRLHRAAPLAQLSKCSGYIYCVHVNRYSAGIALIRELSVALCVYFSHTVSVNTVSHAKTLKKRQGKQCWIKSSIVLFYVRWRTDSMGKFYDANTRRDLMDHFKTKSFSF